MVYGNAVGSRRLAWRVVSSIEDEYISLLSSPGEIQLAAIAEYKEKIVKELKELCKEIQVCPRTVARIRLYVRKNLCICWLEPICNLQPEFCIKYLVNFPSSTQAHLCEGRQSIIRLAALFTTIYSKVPNTVIISACFLIFYDTQTC